VQGQRSTIALRKKGRAGWRGLFFCTSGAEGGAFLLSQASNVQAHDNANVPVC